MRSAELSRYYVVRRMVERTLPPDAARLETFRRLIPLNRYFAFESNVIVFSAIMKRPRPR